MFVTDHHKYLPCIYLNEFDRMIKRL